MNFLISFKDFIVTLLNTGNVIFFHHSKHDFYISSSFSLVPPPLLKTAVFLIAPFRNLLLLWTFQEFLISSIFINIENISMLECGWQKDFVGIKLALILQKDFSASSTIVTLYKSSSSSLHKFDLFQFFRTCPEKSILKLTKEFCHKEEKKNSYKTFYSRNDNKSVKMFFFFYSVIVSGHRSGNCRLLLRSVRRKRFLARSFKIFHQHHIAQTRKW